MRTKNGGDFSKTVRAMASRMRQMPIFSRMYTRSRRVMPTIPESASNQATSNRATNDTAKSIAALNSTIELIEDKIIEYEKKKEVAINAQDTRRVRLYEYYVQLFNNHISNLKVQRDALNALVSLTARDASTSRNGGKIMRKSKRRIRRIRKTRRHKN